MFNSAYAISMQSLGTVFSQLGILDFDSARTAGRFRRWSHSLFSIYDVERLNRLDLPWWTLRAAALVDGFLARRPEARVFEFGAGASTLFLARRCQSLSSVEHDAAWFPAIRGLLDGIDLDGRDNVHLTLVEPDAAAGAQGIFSERAGWQGMDFDRYVRSLEAHDDPFDLIVIDGRCRAACLEVACSKVRNDGIILFDNADRKRYRPAIESCSLPKLWTRGMTACLPYPDSTLLLSKRHETLNSLT